MSAPGGAGPLGGASAADRTVLYVLQACEWQMTEPVSIFETIDEEAEAQAIARARADIAAGRLVPHDKVVEWLRSWGTPNELPCPIPPKR